jgi:hypothetical protein
MLLDFGYRAQLMPAAMQPHNPLVITRIENQAVRHSRGRFFSRCNLSPQFSATPDFLDDPK